MDLDYLPTGITNLKNSRRYFFNKKNKKNLKIYYN